MAHLHVVADETNPKSVAAYVQARTKTAKRQFVGDHATLWLKHMHRSGERGAVYIDIDDTIINGHEKVAHGFEEMLAMFKVAAQLFDVHVCTARPDDDHENVMALLHRLDFRVPPSRLHMLPARDYDAPDRERRVQDFKDRTYHKILREHGFVVARFGDRKWDVAPRHAPHLDHVSERACYIMFDHHLCNGRTLSAKLPG